MSSVKRRRPSTESGGDPQDSGAARVPLGRRRRPAGSESARLGLLLAIPAVGMTAFFVFYPLVLGFKSSVESSSLYGVTEHWVGARNYDDGIHTPEVISSILHTLVYLAVAVSLEIVLGVCFALVLNRVFPGRGIVLAILILPWALPSVVSGVLWRRIFDPDNGLLNSVLVQSHLIHQPQVWMAGQWAIAFITLVHVWGVLPLVTLIFMAALQSIPDEVYAASAVDGAAPIAQFRYITLPLLRPAVAVALTVGTILAISIFDEIYVLNGTALNTRSVLMQVYNTTFVDADFAHGTALAFMLAGVTALFGITYVLSLRRAS